MGLDYIDTGTVYDEHACLLPSQPGQEGGKRGKISDNAREESVETVR